MMWDTGGETGERRFQRDSTTIQSDEDPRDETAPDTAYIH
jgi:hypothetical protein